MTDEVYTDCPNCGEQIPFYRTVDGTNSDLDDDHCPECGTDSEELFEIALSDPIDPAPEPSTDPLLADGGLDE